MNRFKEILLGNLPIKILSFTLAVIFWFATMNVNNPVIEKDFSLPLELRNEHLITDKNFVIVNQEALEKTNIQVKIKGKRNDIDSLRRYPDAIGAYVDLSTIDLSNESNIGQIISVPVEWSNNYPDTFTIVGGYPLTVLINIDVIESKTIPVYANVTGTPLNSYVLEGNPILAKSSITITGPKTILDGVTKAVLPLNVEGATLDIEQAITPVIMDENNKDVTSTIYSGLDPINVLQKVSKATTVEIISPSLVGTLPSGHTLIEYSTDIQTVDVLADESNPDLSFNPIILDPIDISNVIETQSFEEDITAKLAAAGLRAKEDEQVIVTTTLIIESDVQNTFEIPLSQIEFSAVSYTYTILNPIDNLMVTLSGPESIMTNITASDIDLYCELPLTPENPEFIAVVDVTLPEGFNLIEVPVLHIAIDSPTEQTPE